MRGDDGGQRMRTTAVVIQSAVVGALTKLRPFADLKKKNSPEERQLLTVNLGNEEVQHTHWFEYRL